MSQLDKAEMTAAKACAVFFKTLTRFIGRVDRIFRVPKQPKAMKYWRDVQIAFWAYLSLLTSYFVLPLVIQLINVLRR